MMSANIIVICNESREWVEELAEIMGSLERWWYALESR